MWLWKWKAKTKQRQFQRVRSVGTKPFASKMPETREIITVLEICQTLIYSKSSSLTESNSLTLCILVFKLNSVWSIASWLYSNPSTTWKVSKYGVFSGPYFPAFGLNTEIYLFSRNAGKYGPEKTPYLDTFHAVKGKVIYLLFVYSWLKNIKTIIYKPNTKIQ